MNEIKIFSPATVANVSCGFDVLGFCLDNIGDEMTIRKVDSPGIFLGKLSGFEIPSKPQKNVSYVAATALYKALNLDFGFEIDIQKNIKPGSGIGSSSASAIGAVFGINYLLDNHFNTRELLEFAMKGEAVASGAEHADNLAPGLLGNFTLIRGYNPLDVIKIEAPDNLYATILHPQIEIKTSESRALLPKDVPLSSAIKQWGNLGGLIAGLHQEDYKLISRSLIDHVVEPFRSKLIPEFETVKTNVLAAGALGCGISGSGPSIYALSEGNEIAEKVEHAMRQVYLNTDISIKSYVSKINQQGIKILS